VVKLRLGSGYFFGLAKLRKKLLLQFILGDIRPKKASVFLTLSFFQWQNHSTKSFPIPTKSLPASIIFLFLKEEFLKLALTDCQVPIEQYQKMYEFFSLKRF